MTVAYFDRVKQISATTGTGDITFGNVAPGGYRTFASVYTGGENVPYCIADQNGNQWEVGIGAYNPLDDTLSRNEVLSSSNSNMIVDFTSGALYVFVTLPADLIDQDISANILQQNLALGETTSAYRIVSANVDGKVYIASSDDLLTGKSVRGITTQAGVEDEEVNVVSEGEIENSSWNWDSAKDLFLGVGGVVTDTAPTSGYVIRVGCAVSAHKMYVSIGPAVFLT